MPMAARTAVATIAGLVVVALVGALALCGVGGSFSEVESMFMGSAQHRENILGDYALAGVGVTTGGDGRVWVTAEFAATGAGAEPAGASATRSSSSSSSSPSSTLLPLDGGATRDYVRAWGRPS